MLFFRFKFLLISKTMYKKIFESNTPFFSFSFFRQGLIPILLWVLFTPFSSEIDLWMSRFFFQNHTFSSNSFWSWLYIYGLAPAWILTAIAFAGLIASFIKSKSSWRNPCLYLIATFALGGGLIIHACLKDHWGRPRPKQTIEFGGTQDFRPYYKPNLSKSQAEPSKSFPCGHASSGFYFFSLAFLGAIYHSRFIYWLGMSLAWGLGILLSLTRIAQGGHFFSDTLATALIMWLTALGLAYLFFHQKLKNEKFNPKAN